MRHAVSETNERVDNVYSQFGLIDEKFVENKEVVDRLKTSLSSSHTQISEAFDMIEKISKTQR